MKKLRWTFNRLNVSDCCKRSCCRYTPPPSTCRHWITWAEEEEEEGLTLTDVFFIPSKLLAVLWCQEYYLFGWHVTFFLASDRRQFSSCWLCFRSECRWRVFMFHLNELVQKNVACIIVKYTEAVQHVSVSRGQRDLWFTVNKVWSLTVWPGPDRPQIWIRISTCLPQEDILSIWNRTSNDQTTTSRIRDTLRRVLNLPTNTIMEYKTHNDSLRYDRYSL